MNLASMSGEWTSTTPTKPGWYWWKQEPSDRYPKGFERIVHLEFVGGTLWWNCVRAVNDEIGKWSGPLTPPGGGT